MGWAIRRADGTYRAWNANAQDDALQAGETWVELTAPPTVTGPPTADPVGFERDLLALFSDPIQRNTLLKFYPLFLWALRGRDWPSVQAILTDAQATLAITPVQYAAIKAAATARLIPVTLA